MEDNKKTAIKDKNEKKVKSVNFALFIKRISYYFRLWTFLSKNSFMVYLNQKKILAIFLTGKILRFFFFTMFLYFLVLGAENLAGYSIDQTIFFFLTFNVVDVMAQFLFREVYRFRPLLVSGDFDLILQKPMNSLFRVLAGGADFIDLITIPPLIIATWYFGAKLGPETLNIFFYLILIFNGLMIAAAFHIAVLAMGIITLEIDHTIMVYRDITNLGRFPIDIYKEPIRSFLMYFVPVGIMITLPAKAFMGLVSMWGVAGSFLLGTIAIFASLRFWNFALKKYSSASS